MGVISNIELPDGSLYNINADTVDNLHIKTATVSAGTDDYGNVILWDVSANIIPFFAYASNISNIICRPFIGNSRKSWMLAIDNSSTHQQ